MKLPPFDHSKAHWDEYQRFHVSHSIHYRKPYLIQFDTGEAIVPRYVSMRPKMRRHYKDANIEFLSPHDPQIRDYKFTDCHGKPVMRNHIRKGQMLLLDHDTGRAVAVRRGDDWDTSVPEKLRSRAAVYFSGPDQPPQSGGSIYEWRPAPMTIEQRRHIAALRTVCKAWMAMASDDEKYTEDQYDKAGTTIISRKHIATWEYTQPTTAEQLLRATSMQDLRKEVRLRLALHGYKNTTMQLVTHKYLKFTR